MSAPSPLRVGIIGTGNISLQYLHAARLFPQIQVVSCADLLPASAAERAREFGLRAQSVEDLLRDDGVDLVLNLTIPASHVAVNLAALRQGKHVYSEKPFGLSTEESKPVLELAASRNLRVGSAPDTFLGAGYQTARKLIDDGAIGAPVGGTAYFMSNGPERWHPNPAFFYGPGAGPVFDMGPYYLTALINLFGPIRRVFSAPRTPRAEREVGSGPLQGNRFPVTVPTTVFSLLEFASGPVFQFVATFDGFNHNHPPIEVFGSDGALQLPDPNEFWGNIRLLRHATGRWSDVAPTHPYGAGRYRSLGVADLAVGLSAGRPHRASGEMAFHVLEVMEVLTGPRAGTFPVEIASTCARPAPFAPATLVSDLA